MPGTEVATASYLERLVCWYFVIPLVLLFGTLGVPCMFGLAGYYIYLEERVASVPVECFDRIRCEVLKVSQVFNSSDCADVFAYQWKASDSMALFYQEEEIRKRDCSQPSKLTTENASFAVGPATCFRTKTEFLEFQSDFNCAQLLPFGNGSASICHTLLTPASSTSILTSVSTLVVLCLIVFVSCCLAATSVPTVDEDWQQQLAFLDVHPEDVNPQLENPVNELTQSQNDVSRISL